MSFTAPQTSSPIWTINPVSPLHTSIVKTQTEARHLSMRIQCTHLTAMRASHLLQPWPILFKIRLIQNKSSGFYHSRAFAVKYTTGKSSSHHTPAAPVFARRSVASQSLSSFTPHEDTTVFHINTVFFLPYTMTVDDWIKPFLWSDRGK